MEKAGMLLSCLILQENEDNYILFFSSNVISAHFSSFTESNGARDSETFLA